MPNMGSQNAFLCPANASGPNMPQNTAATVTIKTIAMRRGFITQRRELFFPSGVQQCATGRLGGKKLFSGSFENRLPFFECKLAEFTPRTNPPLARLGNRIKVLFHLGHGSERLEPLCVQAGNLARDSQR